MCLSIYNLFHPGSEDSLVGKIKKQSLSADLRVLETNDKQVNKYMHVFLGSDKKNKAVQGN